MRGAIATAVRVLGAEGPGAARDRFLDRLLDWRRRRQFRAAPRRGLSAAAIPVLNVLPTAPVRRLGGLQAQFLRRIDEEAAQRACAVLYPDRRGYRLECQRGDRREARELDGPAPPSPVSLEDAGFEAAVLESARRTGARALHVEGLSGLPAATLVNAQRAGLRLILTAHDFSLFCARPHLLEQPASAFCGYCEDLGRCRACLRHSWNVAADFQRRYRAVGAELLKAAGAVVYPSEFLRSKFLDLVHGLDAARHHVIAPGRPGVDSGSEMRRRPGPMRHVALVGAVQIQKGAVVFERVVQQLHRERPGRVRWSVLGGGDADLLRRLRRLPSVSVRGYYRAGSLPELLRRRRVDLALLLSISPESYGLTLDECLAAGVPVIAFDHGAMAERVRRFGGGILVPPAADWHGVLAALRDALDREPPVVDPDIPRRLPTVVQAARAHLELYRELKLI